MNKPKILLNTPELKTERHLVSLIENQTNFGLNNCEFSIYETHRPAFDVRLHFDTIAFTSMLRGKKQLKLEHKTEYFDYTPGESVLVSPGETMIIDFPEADENPSQCIALRLAPEFVEKSLYELNYDFPKVDETSRWKIDAETYFMFNSQSLVAATNNIMRVAMEDNVQKDVIADFALKELLIRLMQTQARIVLEKDVVNGRSRMAFVVDYIKKNLHNKLSIDAIAKLAYVSKSNFFRMFKDELGISPNEFILQERINSAKRFLSNQISIKETAFRTGFSDANYFTRVFKQVVGITPTNYRGKNFLTK